MRAIKSMLEKLRDVASIEALITLTRYKLLSISESFHREIDLI